MSDMGAAISGQLRPEVSRNHADTPEMTFNADQVATIVLCVVTAALLSGSEYEWEHGARVRNCTQLHWTLDAAVPRVRRQELIPRAKLKPAAQHNIWRTMSSSSDCSAARRPSRTDAPQEGGEAQTARRGSRYEIYGTATRPFGESYRRSQLQQCQGPVQEPEAGQERAATPDSPLDTDSVEDDMGCSTSRTKVADDGVKGTFQQTAPPADPRPAKTDVKVNSVVMKATHNKTLNNNTIHVYKGLSDFEIIYGTDDPNKNSTDEGYSTTDIYSEVKKPEKVEKKSNQSQKSRDQTPREKLMQQIRDRKGEESEEKTNYCSFSIENPVEDNKITKNERNHVNAVKSEKVEEEISTKIAASEPVSFVEEEYSYEPDKKEATSKLVVRSRSLVNLDQPPVNNTCTLNRPNKLKITTKPDGTIRYGLRQGCSEPDLLDDSPALESEVRNNYVSSIKSAFDAAIESQSRDKDRAEAFDGLRQYFHDNKHGLQELLVNNNVVIIEPFRPDPPKSPSEKSDTSSQRTCRITGATIKSPNGEPKSFVPSNTLPRRHTKCNRPTKQGFYHPIKVNKELIDAELPDPDKVKNAKELFEKIFKSRSSTETPKKNTASRSFFNTITSKMRITPEVKVVQEGKPSKKQNRLLIDQVTREDMKRCTLQRRWTDSGSLSSGVSSDFSCDQDCDYYHQDTHADRIMEEYSSDDEVEYIYPYDDAETHPVSPEVLQKIRACGTSVTYYGGRVIARSHGPLRSPMTMTIMDEIRRHGGTHEGRKRFEEEPALGVKFRLVKSHSCGSRLEIAGTEDSPDSSAAARPATSPHPETIAEEEAAPKPADDSPHTSLEGEEEKAEADRYGTTETTSTTTTTTTGAAPPVMTWAELKLKEARRLWHCAPEAVRAPPQDMEFETFEVLEDPKPHKQEQGETGRG